MARRRGRRGRRGGFKLPVISLAILGGQVLLAHQRGGGDWGVAADNFQSFYTGYSFRTGTFAVQNLGIGYVPWLAKRFLLPIARPRIGGMKLPVSIS